MSGTRSGALDRLADVHWDVVVIGAGIIGSRVAYEAARSGLRVALVDAGDFGGATSSATSKFVHGGLRYMSSWQVRLVRSSQREREALRRLAPHLVRRRPMVFAGSAGYPLPAYAAGLALYKGISGIATPWPRIITARRGQELAPFFRPNGTRTCTLLPEAQTHDSRFTLATVRAAVSAGACAVSYVRALELERLESRVERVVLEGFRGEGLVSVRARAVVNATGPWVDEIRRLEDPTCAPLMRLSRGTHVVLSFDEEWETGVASSLDGSGTTFAVPFYGMLLLGVTDTPYEGAPGEVAPTSADVEELFERASRFIAPELLDRGRMRHVFAGLRVLPDRQGDTGRLPREHLISTGPGGMISVAGGKLTTHRLTAVDALRRLPPELRPRRLRASDESLAGAAAVPPGPLAACADPALPDPLLARYGSEIGALLAYGEADSAALERIDPAGPDVWAQVTFAVEHEWAQTADDIVHRRTTLALRGLDTPATRARIGALLARTSSRERESGTSVGVSSPAPT